MARREVVDSRKIEFFFKPQHAMRSRLEVLLRLRVATVVVYDEDLVILVASFTRDAIQARSQNGQLVTGRNDDRYFFVPAYRVAHPELPFPCAFHHLGSRTPSGSEIRKRTLCCVERIRFGV